MVDYVPLPYKINPSSPPLPPSSSIFHTKSPPSPPLSSPFYSQSSPAPRAPPSSTRCLPQSHPPPLYTSSLTQKEKYICACYIVSFIAIICIVLVVVGATAIQAGQAERDAAIARGEEVRSCLQSSKFGCVKWAKKSGLPKIRQTVPKVPKIAINLVKTLDILNELDRNSSEDCRQPPQIGGGTWRECQQNIQMEYFNGTKCTFECDADLVLATSKGFDGRHDKSIVFTCVRTHWVPSVPFRVKCLTVMEFESKNVG